MCVGDVYASVYNVKNTINQLELKPKSKHTKNSKQGSLNKKMINIYSIIRVTRVVFNPMFACYSNSKELLQSVNDQYFFSLQ